MTIPRQRVVILGGGFAGLYTALQLERTLARDPDVEVTLVNQDNFFLFTPLLHEVAASDVDLTHIVNPIRKLIRRVRFFAGTVQGIDLENQVVHVWHGDQHHGHELPYDHLVLAMGNTTNFFDLPGVAENAFTMKTLGDAIRLRNRVIGNLEEADFECCPVVRRKSLTFVVAGGGFAGTETIGAVNDFARRALRSYPNLRPEMLRFVLVHPGEVILPELGESLGRYAQEKLRQRGIEVRLNTKVESMGPEGVTLSDGEVIETNTLVWTAGTAPNPLLASLACEKVRGRLVVDETMRVKGRPGVWAAGDCAAIPDPLTGGYHPPTAQHGVRQGKVLGKNLTASVRGGDLEPFRFRTLGALASIGRRAGVAQVFGLKFSGFFAWWLWRTVYLMKLPRLEKKLRVVLDWTLDLFFHKDLVQYLTTLTPRNTPAEAEALTTNA